MTYYLIDSPVNAFSESADIRDWLKKLNEMPKSTQREDEIARVMEMLEYAMQRELS